MSLRSATHLSATAIFMAYGRGGRYTLEDELHKCICCLGTKFFEDMEITIRD
jgi:hypothetical protein